MQKHDSTNSRNGYSPKTLKTEDGEFELLTPRERPLESIYPILYLDCIVVKIRQDNQVIDKVIYLARGVNLEGYKELLAMWISENEGAKFWLNVMTELQNRGVKDILIACIDRLKGFAEAINAVFPSTKIQLCIVHMVSIFQGQILPFAPVYPPNILLIFNFNHISY